ncbi:hypothetical protein C5167_032611 [Papaver somniferum]|uniref:DNA polymerase delta subunit 4 n=1 Tax=Papaver somniferum TaxID=3469 RepID=A0A4Y7KC02_PAPSO|nr:uncharacterized protein LOC113297541 isoform X1 [Papaver somniferum]RZC69479.1 hypothetical protein C5167_032611 [Papaver somniferum]
MGSKGDIKGFFRQKKSSGVTKPNNKTTKSSSSFSKKAATTLGSDQTQPSALISHGSLDLKDDHNENEEILRQFDMNMKYGPCIGMTRLARWERAKNLGMNPPKEIETCLRQAKVGLECLWSSRV